MTAKKIFLYLCISVISIVMLSCSRTVEIDEVNIRNYFSSFPVEAQDIIAQGKFIIKTVGGMPSESVLVGISSYNYALQDNMAEYESIGTVEDYARGSGTSQQAIDSMMVGHMYSIDEFRSQFNMEISDWSRFEMWYSEFHDLSGRRVNGWIFTSIEKDLAVYLLFLDNM